MRIYTQAVQLLPYTIDVTSWSLMPNTTVVTKSMDYVDKGIASR